MAKFSFLPCSLHPERRGSPGSGLRPQATRHLGLVPLPPQAEGAGRHTQSTHQVSVVFDMVEEEELVDFFCYIFSYMRYLVIFFSFHPELRE